MITKELEFKGQDEEGNVFCRPLSNDGLIKTAQAECYDLHPLVRSFVDGMQPTDRGIYVLVSALGAGEYWGSNSNGDLFPEAALINAPSDWAGIPVFDQRKIAKTWSHGYPTFLNAYPYKHHASNKDPSKAFGRVEVAAWNEKMRRVELIVFLDRDKCVQQGALDVYQRIENGEFPDVSMGCSVPYDVCTYCGNKSKTRHDYCVHARTMMNKIMPNGIKIAVINLHPKFFDISFVFIGADKTAKVLLKLAEEGAMLGFPSTWDTSGYVVVPNDRVAFTKVASLFPQGGEKNASHRKLSEIIKDIPASNFSKRILPRIERSEPSLPARLISKLRPHSMNTTCSSAASLGIVMKPREFQRLVLIKMGEEEWADELDNTNTIFAPTTNIESDIGISPRFVDEAAQRDLETFIETRSALEPFLTNRPSGPMNMERVTFSHDPYLEKIAAAYNGYRESLLYSMKDMSNNSMLTSDPSRVSTEEVFGRVKHANANVFGPDSFAYLLGAYYDDRGTLFATEKVADILGSIDPNMAVTLSSEPQ